jgi:hypothetical protein
MLTDSQVRASALAFAQYNGWSSAGGDMFFMDLDNTVRGASSANLTAP